MFIARLFVPPALLLVAAPAVAQSSGVNVLLNQPPTPEVLASLATVGDVLDVIPDIKGVTLRAKESQLPAIRSLACVASAGMESVLEPAGHRAGQADPADLWNLDAVNVTDNGVDRTVSYDGTGVYIAVIGTGLPVNWRDYFPEANIAASLARGFSGGGGERGSVSEPAQFWEHDTIEHELAVTSIILGFRYWFESPALPLSFPGVAPGATVIPLKCNGNNNENHYLASTLSRAIVYAANLKISGALGSAPLVINASWGGFRPDPLIEAAVNYAIDHGVPFVAAAGNEASQGMRLPAAYPQVISAAATGFVGEFPADDPTLYTWFTRDVAEGDPSQHFIAPFSAWQLPGQDLDIAAPGFMMPVPYSVGATVNYSYFAGTSAATPHVAGIVALMLQKNPNLSPSQIEAILENSAMPLAPDCRSVMLTAYFRGVHPLLSNQFLSAEFFPANVCWGANATGHGLLQADAALAATPLP